jgi:hypothetical protein
MNENAGSKKVAAARQYFRQFLITLLFLLLVLPTTIVLSACGDKVEQTGATDTTSYSQDSSGIDTTMSDSERRQVLYDSSRPAKNPDAALEQFISDAQEQAIILKSNTSPSAVADQAGLTEVELQYAQSDIPRQFENANSWYRRGVYASAFTAYNDILTIAPLHYGARVNLALAYLQLADDRNYDRNEMNANGLRCACEALALWPDDLGCLINLQVAAVANGYDMQELDNAMTSGGRAKSYRELYSLAQSENSDFSNAITYNHVYSLTEQTFAENDDPQAAYDQLRFYGLSGTDQFWQDYTLYLNAYAKAFDSSIEIFEIL